MMHPIFIGALCLLAAGAGFLCGYCLRAASEIAEESGESLIPPEDLS